MYKQVDPRSAADARTQEILETATTHNGQRYDVGVLWADDNIQPQITTFHHCYSSSLSKSGSQEIHH